MIGRWLRKGMILLLVLLWPVPSRAASSERGKPSAAIAAQTTKSAAPKPDAVSTGRQVTEPQLSSEDRKVVKMMDLLEKMEMLQDMDLVTATEDKR